MEALGAAQSGMSPAELQWLSAPEGHPTQEADATLQADAGPPVAQPPAAQPPAAQPPAAQ